MIGLNDRGGGSGEIFPHWRGRLGLVRHSPAYYLTVTKPGAPFIEATVRYLSFFTILTNILVALALTLPWLAPDTRLGAFFTRPSVRTAILTYIIIVAVIYHYLLANLWNPQGWQLLADTIEHVVTPALYVIDWVLFAPKGTVRWRSAFAWLYPLAYAAYSLIHGAVTGSLSLHQCRRPRLRQDVPQHGRAGAGVLRAWPRPDRHRSPHGAQQQCQGLAHAAAVNLAVSLGRKECGGGVQKELESMTEPDHRRRKAERTESPSVIRTQALMPSGAGQAGALDRLESPHG